MAAGVERAGGVPRGGWRRPAHEILRAGDAAVSFGHAAHGPHAELHHWRRGGAVQAHARLQRAAPDGLGRVRLAGGERGDQECDAPARMDAARTSRSSGEYSTAFGFSYDWRREISTCEPEYYRWNQWFFLRMLEKGIAYRKKQPGELVSRNAATVLANEQVIDGCCWRHETTPVEAKEIEQWFLRITQYADELLDEHGAARRADGRSACCRCSGTGSGNRAARACDSTIAGIERAEPGSVYHARGHDLWRVGDFAFAGASRTGEIARGRAGHARRWKRSSEPCGRQACAPPTLPRPRRKDFLPGDIAVNPFSGEQRPDLGGEFRPRGIRDGRGDVRSGARPARLRIRGEISACRCRWWCSPRRARRCAPESLSAGLHGIWAAGGIQGRTRGSPPSKRSRR